MPELGGPVSDAEGQYTTTRFLAFCWSVGVVERFNKRCDADPEIITLCTDPEVRRFEKWINTTTGEAFYPKDAASRAKLDLLIARRVELLEELLAEEEDEETRNGDEKRRKRAPCGRDAEEDRPPKRRKT